MSDCNGTHRYFVAETAAVEKPGANMVYVFIVCTSCGEPQMLKFELGENVPQLSNKNTKEN